MRNVFDMLPELSDRKKFNIKIINFLREGIYKKTFFKSKMHVFTYMSLESKIIKNYFSLFTSCFKTKNNLDFEKEGKITINKDLFCETLFQFFFSQKKIKYNMFLYECAKVTSKVSNK